MSGGTAMQALTRDHEVIEQAVAGLGRLAHSLSRGHKADVELLRDAVRFLSDFADGCHHRKEEGWLFPALESKGIPERGGPLGVMKHEHEEARALVAAFGEAVESYAAGGPGSVDRLVRVIGGIGEVYPIHMLKEENVLFQLAEQVLSPEDLRRLAEGFETIERETGVAAREGFVGTARRLGEVA